MLSDLVPAGIFVAWVHKIFFTLEAVSPPFIIHKIRCIAYRDIVFGFYYLAVEECR